MVWWEVLQQYERYFITFRGEKKIINYVKSSWFKMYKNWCFLKRICWSQQAVLSRNQRLRSCCTQISNYIIVYSYLYYFCCFSPFLWTTYSTSDSYISAFSYFSRIQNNISGTKSIPSFRRESMEKPTESCKTEALFSITGPHTISTFFL